MMEELTFMTIQICIALSIVAGTKCFSSQKLVTLLKNIKLKIQSKFFINKFCFVLLIFIFSFLVYHS